MRGIIRKGIMSAVLLALSACGGGGGDGGGSNNTANAPNEQGLAEVKAFVTDVRTWGTVISDAAKSKHDVFTTQLDMAGSTFDIVGGDMVNALVDAYYAALKAYLDGANLDLATYFVASKNASGSAIVSGNSVTVDGSINSQNVKLVIQFPDLSTSATQFTFTVITAEVKNPAAELTAPAGAVPPGVVTITYLTEQNLQPWFDGTNTSDTFPDSETIDIRVAASLTETMTSTTNPVSFSGSVDISLLVMRDSDNNLYHDASGYVDYNPANIDLSGTLKDLAGNQFAANLNATMNNADTFVPNPPGTPEESADNFRDITLSLTFTESLVGLPDAEFTLSADRDGFKSGNASLSIAYDKKRIDVVVNVDNADTITSGSSLLLSGNVTITNDAGVQIVLTPNIADDITHITYKGADYGYITDSSGMMMIHYYTGEIVSL